MPNGLQGQDVTLNLTTADAFTAAVPLVITDSNGVLRPLQAYERLVIDSLTVDVDGAAQRAAVIDPGAAATAQVMGVFSVFVGAMVTTKEGQNVSPGTTPQVTAQAAGAVIVQGTGRVTVAKSQGVQAGYKQLLTPGGNTNWQ